VKRAITTHTGDFAAILVLLVLSVVVAGYILNHERLRFPFIQSTPFTINAEMSTGQAFTPGQGQTVVVSGVKVGDVGSITLKNGVAVIQMSIDEKFKHLIHNDATALARPRTGLQDMFIELNPGTSAAPVAKPGYTIPVSNAMPEVNVDEILSSLDADTREYLQLLVNGAGQGLQGQGGNELAQVLERFLPTHQDLARLNGVVAQRGSNLRQLVSSLARLNTALADKQHQIMELVNSSSQVFRAWASQNQNVSRAVADLPATLSQTTATLAKVQAFAQQLGPAARNLLPAAVNLAAATPNLSRVFAVLNHFVNLVGYNPGGSQHGYLWWLAWLDHNARTLFSVQDANGDFRPLFLQASCATLAQVANNIPGSESVLNTTSILTNAGLCPKQAAADSSAYQRYQQTHGSTGIHATPDSGSGAGGAGASGGAGNLFLPKLPTN
jgi:phospholipid/cholesterol/gamma-HCH transport system substrate-binding protein